MIGNQKLYKSIKNQTNINQNTWNQQKTIKNNRTLITINTNHWESMNTNENQWICYQDGLQEVPGKITYKNCCFFSDVFLGSMRGCGGMTKPNMRSQFGAHDNIKINEMTLKSHVSQGKAIKINGSTSKAASQESTEKNSINKNVIFFICFFLRGMRGCGGMTKPKMCPQLAAHDNRILTASR